MKLEQGTMQKIESWIDEELYLCIEQQKLEMQPK